MAPMALACGRKNSAGRAGRALLLAMVTWVAMAALLEPKPSPAAIEAGALDRSFSRDGRLFGPGGLHWLWDRAHSAMAVAPDGSVLVASVRLASPDRPTYGRHYEIQLHRYLPNGDLDLNFGNGGMVVARTQPGYDFVFTDLAVDSAGRPILLGTSYGEREFPSPDPYGAPYPSFVTAIRYRADGSLDSDFGEGDGIALLRFDSPPATSPDVPGASLAEGDLDALDRIVLVVAQREVGGPRAYHFVNRVRLVARLTPDGALDSSFGEGDGVAQLPFSSIQDMSLDRHGQLTLSAPPAVRAPGRPTQIAQLFRLTVDGVPDQSFGPGGLRDYARTILPTDIANDPFGRIFVRGSIPGREGVTGVARLKWNGRVDRSFGKHGLAQIALPGRSYLRGIASDRHGGLFLVGTLFLRKSSRIPWWDAKRAFVVIHRLRSGKLDRRFGQGGRVVTRFGRLDAGAREASLDPSGHLVVSGLARLHNAALDSLQVVARYLAE